MSDAAEALHSQYKSKGFVVLRNQIPLPLIDDFMKKLRDMTQEMSGERIDNPFGPEMGELMNRERSLQSRIYDEIRKPDWLTGFSKHESVTTPVKKLMGPAPVSLFSKIIFRIDAPRETSELAVWHQDFNYVKGNQDVITAWMPMRDTSFAQGCLMVMPESHKLGPLAHEEEVLGKRHYPNGIFDREVRYVEMRKGDILLFHSCLLHSSGINVSDVCRFSIQARYTPSDAPVDPGMGKLISV